MEKVRSSEIEPILMRPAPTLSIASAFFVNFCKKRITDLALQQHPGRWGRLVLDKADKRCDILPGAMPPVGFTITLA
jgi:hypothetical protein